MMPRRWQNTYYGCIDMAKKLRVFQAIDLDRTLFDTRKLEEVSYALVARMHPHVAERASKESAEHIAAGVSFFIFRFLREHLTKQEYDDYIAELKRTTKFGDFCLKGVAERVAFATSQPGWAAGVLTYGLYEDQYLKMELCGIAGVLPMLNTDTPDKGQVIATWQQPDGTFALPEELGGGTTDIVTLEDDKPEAFVHLPSNSYGVLVVGKSVTTGRGIPEYAQPVKVADTLYDSMDYLINLLTD